MNLTSGVLSIDVLPARGLDLGRATFRGEVFSWTSNLGHVDWQGDFFESFGGGLMFTCGLRNVGRPSEGHPQHGLYTAQPAVDVDAGTDWATGRVVDGPLELQRKLGEVRVTVTSDQPRLWQWIEPTLGVIGIEPANCSVLGRAHDRAEARLPELAPGEARDSSLEIAVEAS